MALDLTPDAEQHASLPPLTVACPDCGSAAGQLCTSHDGTRARKSQVHRARTAVWEEARIAAHPAAQLVDTHRRGGLIRHGQHAVNLLRTRGFTADADRVQREVQARNGLMSAKQAVQFLLDGGEEER